MNAELKQALIEAAVEKARVDFYAFVQLMAPLVIPEDFRDGRHIALICHELQEIEQKRNDRLMLEMSPGSMKSKITSVLFPAWLLGVHPNWQILAVSHTKELAEKFGRETKNLVDSPDYQVVFPRTKVRSDSRAAARWGTTEKGEYYATGAGASIAGFRGNVILADDLLSEQTAYSKIDREKVVNWWAPGLRSRLLPDGGIVLVNTRWHLADVSGSLRQLAKSNPEADQWRTITIPAILDAASADLLELEEGSSYWPELWSTELLLKTRENMAPARWSSLYMQDPTADGGSIFDMADFEDWPEASPPPIEYILVSADTAFSKSETADYSALQVWGIFQHMGIPNMIMLGSRKERYSFDELMEEIKQLHWAHEADLIVVEKKASGQSVIQELQRQGLPVWAYTPDRDKVTRAHAAQPIVKAGRVWLPKTRGWAKDFLMEAQAFPVGAHDDQVDAAVMAILWLRSSYKIRMPDDPEDAKPKPSEGGYWFLS